MKLEVNWKDQKSKFHTNFIKKVVNEYGKWLKENSRYPVLKEIKDED